MNVRSFAKSLATLAAIALTSYFIEVHLHRKGVPSRDLILLSNVMVGMVGAALVYVLSVRERQRQQYVECRLRVIAEMNHHIRNALQVIAFYSRKGQKQEVGIGEAVDRIQWALREVLPQLPEQPPRKNAPQGSSKLRSSERPTRVRSAESPNTRARRPSSCF